VTYNRRSLSQQSTNLKCKPVSEAIARPLAPPTQAASLAGSEGPSLDFDSQALTLTSRRHRADTAEACIPVSVSPWSGVVRRPCQAMPRAVMLAVGALLVGFAAAGVSPCGGGLRGWNTFDGYLGPSNESAFTAGMEYVHGVGPVGKAILFWLNFA
jgi:hypothetical protein